MTDTTKAPLTAERLASIRNMIMEQRGKAEAGSLNAEIGRIPLQLLDHIDYQQAEIGIADLLIAERNRILDALPCPEHGQCVPHVLEEIERLKAEIERLNKARTDQAMTPERSVTSDRHD